MKKRAIWIALTILMVTSLVLASCSTSTTTNTQTTASLSPTTTTTIMTTSTTTATIPTSTASTTATTSATTTPTGNWWDNLGIPTYGGTLTISLGNNITGWDNYSDSGMTSIIPAYEEALTTDDWTLNPSVFAYQLSYRSSNYEVGYLGSSWEFTNPQTYVVHLRQNVYWQNLPPANGTQFTSADVVWDLDRLLGLGDGFSSPSPYYASSASSWANLTSITASDKYTVVFVFNQNESEEAACEILQGGGDILNFESPLAVQAYGNVNDWHHAIGTGPFILTDFVDGTAATLVKNPNYWGYDERYPKNQLPYVSGLKVLVIPAQPTALAAVRAGKIDVIDNVSIQDAQNMKKTNPQILQLTYPSGGTPTVDPRMDVKPFTDINVRIAMQMAINLQDIANSYYAGTCPPYPSSMTSMYMSGWNYPYPQWPASVQAQYAYNPTQAKALLAAAGYPNGFTTNCVASAAGDLTLLQIVQSEFAAVGITMSISVLDSASWSPYVRAHKQDQLCYGGNSSGFTFPPLMGFNRWRTGYAFSWANVSDPNFDALRNQAVAAPTVAQAQAFVIQGNQYMVQQHWAVCLDTPNYFSIYQPWLHGYSGQVFAISGGGGIGPLYLGFYTSRFWITPH